MQSNKVVFIGDEAVGKTSIINKSIYNSTILEYTPTVGIDFYAKQLDFNGQSLRISIWDSSGQQRFSSLIPSYLRNSNFIIIMYDITSRSTFLNLDKWFNLAQEYSQNKFIFIVGNKNDLSDKRAVTYEEGLQYSRSKNAHFIETSINQSEDFFYQILTALSSTEKEEVEEVLPDNKSIEDETNQRKNKEKFSISASGLKNIIFNSKSEIISSFEFNATKHDLDEDQFCFIIGNYCVITNRFLADFISPRVSHLHHSDITINSIFLNDFIRTEINFNDVFDFELIENFKKITTGNQIEIDLEMSQKLYYLANLLENEEVSNKMKEFFVNDFKNMNINECISCLKFDSDLFNSNDLIDLAASKFYSIDESKLFELPTSILYLILMNENLTLYSEDSLIDFINKLFSSGKKHNDEYDKVDFYELVDFTALSNEKIVEFIDTFDPNTITVTLWKKLTKFFYINSQCMTYEKQNLSKRYFKKD